MAPRPGRLVPVVLGLLISSFLAAQQIPLTNWTVPPYLGSSASGGLTTMADISPGVGFVAVQPCRIVDTRGGGVFTGTYGPPALVANATRSFDINSAAHCTGIPAGVDAYSLNFTVVNTTGGPGDLRAWPTGNPPVQTTSVLNWTGANVIIANATIIGAGTGGSIDVTAAGFGAQLLIDINGYFTDQYNAGVSFHAVSGTSAAAILGENTSGAPGASFPFGVFGHATATGAVETAGVAGQTDSTGGALGAWGVLGVASRDFGRTYGVWGETKSTILGAAGVFGLDGGGLVAGHSAYASAGVRGESLNGSGVRGLTENGAGVDGVVVNPANGQPFAAGYLGVGFVGATKYGVYSSGDAHVAGTFTATTNKGFVQPHPFDASKEIRYISLEGPHTEVYFRGTAQVSRGVTRITVPQDFRFVADAATYSTLVTPVGDMATVAVLSEGPDGIVVRASRDVRVHYVVYAEREAVRNPDPIIENVHFRPDPDRDFLAHLPDTFRQLMIQNGTLKPDGTVNMETARRLGWDKEWEKRNQRVALSTPE